MVERELLVAALEDLGYAWEENGRLGFLGQRVEIKVAGQNFGFRKAGRAYEMLSRGRMPRGLLQQLTQRYAYQAARAKLEAQGFALASEEVKESGEIHLVLRRMA
jgi:hypothetical protein